MAEARTSEEAGGQERQGVEPTVARLAGISYLHIPAVDPAASAAFYGAVFGWRIGGRPGRFSFEDGTRHVIGAWVDDRAAAPASGIVPYVYVASVDETLARVAAAGGQVVRPPYPEGDLRVATFRDPAGNEIGVWQQTAEPARG